MLPIPYPVAPIRQLLTSNETSIVTPDGPRPTSHPTLSVVVPTYRESANVPVLFERVKAVLEGLPWEMIVVDDDSPDGTSEIAFALASADPRMRCLRRVSRSGLAGAVVEGWMSSSADLVAVIDGDLQHDETILPKMIGRSPRDRAIWRSEPGSPIEARRPLAGAAEAERPRGLVLSTDRGRAA